MKTVVQYLFMDLFRFKDYAVIFLIFMDTILLGKDIRIVNKNPGYVLYHT